MTFGEGVTFGGGVMCELWCRCGCGVSFGAGVCGGEVLYYKNSTINTRLAPGYIYAVGLNTCVFRVPV